MNTQKQILVIVVLFFTMVGGCAAYTMVDIPHRAVIQSDWAKEESITRGALLYANNCRSCHGNRGEGSIGLVLNKDEFKNQDPLVLKANQDMIRRTLQCGRAGTLMPAWLRDNGGSLNSEQVNHLVDFITAPLKPGLTDESGAATNKGWLEAYEFGQNLNKANTALIGGDTLDTIAQANSIGLAELAKANGVTPDTPLTAGDVVVIPGFKEMPNGYAYHVYKSNETLAKVADSQHVGAMVIADLNGLAYKFTENKGRAEYTLLDDQGKPVPGLFPNETLKLPDGSEYTVKGQLLEDVAKQWAGTSAASFAEANGVPENAVIRIGNKLVLPHDVFGAVPGDTKNPGTACVQNAVPQSVFQTLPGIGTPGAGGNGGAAPAPPTEVSKEVEITAGANDFTVIADGKKSDLNKGNVLIAVGTAIKFTNVLGLHTITLNGKQDGDLFKQGDTRTITFSTAGSFKLTCAFHPDMLGYLTVQ